MKTTRLLRVFTLFGFLLLFAPFYDSCDGKYVHKENQDGTEIKKPLKEKIYDVVVDEDAFNAFQIASLTVYAVKDTTYTQFKKEVSKTFQMKDWYKNLGITISFFFIFIILISIIQVILSFTKKVKIMNNLALVNGILILITFGYIFFFDISFKHLHQIKWGYYAIIIANILILYYSKLALKIQNINPNS